MASSTFSFVSSPCYGNYLYQDVSALSPATRSAHEWSGEDPLAQVSDGASRYQAQKMDPRSVLLYQADAIATGVRRMRICWRGRVLQISQRSFAKTALRRSIRSRWTRRSSDSLSHSDADSVIIRGGHRGRQPLFEKNKSRPLVTILQGQKRSNWLPAAHHAGRHRSYAMIAVPDIGDKSTASCAPSR